MWASDEERKDMAERREIWCWQEDLRRIFNAKSSMTFGHTHTPIYSVRGFFKRKPKSLLQSPEDKIIYCVFRNGSRFDYHDFGLCRFCPSHCNVFCSLQNLASRLNVYNSTSLGDRFGSDVVLIYFSRLKFQKLFFFLWQKVFKN